MRLLSSFTEMRLYRNKSFLLDSADPRKQKKFGKLTILSHDRTDIYSTLTSGLFINMYYKSFFTDKIIRMKMVSNVMINRRIRVTDVYKDVKEHIPFIRNTYLSTTQYTGYNLIFDASTRLEAIKDTKFLSVNTYIKQVYATMDLIHKDSRFNDYVKKFYVFLIDDSKKIDAVYFNKTNINTFNQAMIYRMFVEPETMVNLIGATFIFMNTTGIFTYFTLTQDMVTNGINKPTLTRFLKIMYGYSAADADIIAESESSFEVEDETKVQHVNAKTDKLVKKLITNPTIRSTDAQASIANAVISKLNNELLDNPEVDQMLSEDYNNDSLDNAIDSLRKIEKPPVSYAVTAADNSENTAFDDEDSEDAIESISNEIDSDEDSISDLDEDEEEAGKAAISAAKKKQLDKDLEKHTRKVKLLQDNMNDVVFGDEDKTFKQLMKEFEDTEIEVHEIPAKVTNQSIKYATGQEATRTYYNKQMDSDIAMVMKFFAQNTDIKVVITDVKKIDVSDPLNALIRYTFKLKDEFDKVHTISYDVPKLIDNKFFLINGTKKVMTGQISSFPVVKIKPDEVHVITNHNQMYITRFGTALDPKIELVKKFLKKIPDNSAYGVTYKIGNSLDINSKYDTVMEYDDLSKNIYTITVTGKAKDDSVTFVFNQHDIRIMMEDLGIAYVEKPGLMPIAITGKKEIIRININTGKDSKEGKFTICDLILSAIRQYSTMDDVSGIIQRITVPKKYMYTRIVYLNRQLSFGVFLGYLFGLETLLKKMGVAYTFQKNKIPSKEDDYTKNFIKFEDGYLYYDINPTRHSLILNGISTEMNTESIPFAEMNTSEPYLDTFDELFRTRHMSKGFNECKTFMIDVFSAQVLQMAGLPYEFLDVMLYANSLLEDNSVIDPKKTQINRIRKLELIPVFMLKSMTAAYQQYKYRYAGSKRGQITVKQNEILQRLHDSRLCNDYDTLNPIREVEAEGTLTYKGPGGCNVDDAYNLSRRAYDKSMVGVIAASSPDSGSVGITRYMSMNPRLTNIRGFMKSGEDADADQIDFGNIGSIAELTVPFAIDHDDPKRLGFVTKESKHVIPSQHTDPLLIGNGVEKVFPYMVSNDFITIAKQSGKVLHVDKKAGIAIVEYKSGVTDTIDIKDRQHKNGGGGFFILNRKEFLFKEGESFKQNDVLSRNPSYFSTTNGRSAPEYNPGTLADVAIIMSHITFEDSSVITERIAEKMSAEIVFCKQISLGAKSLVHDIVHIGDQIATGDPLMIFEDELDDPEINKILNASDKSNMHGLEDIIKHIPKAKISGTIQDIKIYYTVPPEEMSGSIRSIVEDYNASINNRKKTISKYGALNPNEVLTDYVGVTRPNSSSKINGQLCPVGNILVEIYMKYRDYPGSGDKIVFYASMKTVIHRQLPQKLAPYPVGHPERPIDAVLSPISVNARMVTSILYALYGNKLVWGLKEKIRSIFESYKSLERSSVARESFNLEDIDISGSYTFEDTLSVLGLNPEEVKDIVAEEGGFGQPKQKNLYICLYSPKSNSFSKVIQNVTKSIFSHAAWSIDKSGDNFNAMNIVSLTSVRDLINENLNTMEGVVDKETKYHIYRFPVTESEYARALELREQHVRGHLKYSLGKIISIASKIIMHGKTSEFKGFKDTTLEEFKQICSTYVLSVMIGVRPNLLEWFKKRDENISIITPARIKNIPGVQFLFSGNGTKPFARWVAEFESQNGKLPN